MTNTLLKYCGNHSIDDLSLTMTSQATHIGLIFTTESKRHVSISEAEKWFEAIGTETDKQIVGVFVNNTIELIEEAVRRLPIDIIQCHGDETPEDCLVLKKKLKKPIWKVIHHQDHAVEHMKTYKGIASGFVIDTKTTKAWGGSGQSFNWSAIPDYLAEAKRQGVPCFIAGGVNENNIEKLLSYSPSGIDIASGIETSFQKDRARINLIEGKVIEHDRTTQ